MANMQQSAVAGRRAFMQERLHAKQSSDLAVGQSVLFFGCRRADQDYLYGPQLEQWAQQGSLSLFNAFSRQQVCIRCQQPAPPACLPRRMRRMTYVFIAVWFLVEVLSMCLEQVVQVW